MTFVPKPKQGKALWTLAFPDQISIRVKKPRKNYSVSAKRREENKIYKVLRLEQLTEKPFCERCGAPAECVHHWAGRGRNFLVKALFRSSCLLCNTFAKEHPAAARAEKWIAPQGEYATG